MSAPRIIAKDYSGAIRFAREVLELHPNTVRVVSSAGGLAGYGYTLHLAPGWKKNHAIHSINSRLRFKRGIEVIDHEAEVEKESTREVETAPDIGVVDSSIEPTGERDALVEKMADERVDEIANDIAATAERLDVALGGDPWPTEPEETDDPTGTPESGEDAESAEKPVQRRRRRCKKCGELVEPDDVEAHAAQHEEE
jgi:hypothetical protein